MDTLKLTAAATRIALASAAVYAKFGRTPETVELCASLKDGQAVLNAQPEMADNQVQPEDGDGPKVQQ